jgi:hypothetical protein
MKHIKKGKNVVCQVCNKEYAHSSALKKHYINVHEAKELKEVGVPLKPIGEKIVR